MIPLNNDALGAILSLRRNVKRLFGDLPSPDWYIFPHGEGNSKPDPTRPMSSWRTAWRSLTRKAGLAGLRFHDLRHHAITELAESSSSEQTIMSVAGHVSARMLAHYSHVRLQAKRVAVSALCNTGERSVTSQSTSQSRLSSQDGNPKSLKSLVDVTGIEPATPCLQTGGRVDWVKSKSLFGLRLAQDSTRTNPPSCSKNAPRSEFEDRSESWNRNYATHFIVSFLCFFTQSRR